MRKTNLTLGLLISLAAIAAAPGAFPAQDSPRPNFIVVMADDCSAKEFSGYGNTEIQTPNLDELGKSGVTFRTCWSAPICGPSRAMIMTGRYAYRTGWYHNDMKPAQGEKGYNLSEDNLTFAHVLKQAGYATGICGKWQLRGSETSHGFDEALMHHQVKGKFDGPIEPPEGSLPGRPARYWHPAITLNGEHYPTTAQDYGPDLYTDFIIDFARRHKDEPFLMYFPMSLTHITWDFDLEKMGYVAPPELDAKGNKTGRKGEPTLKANVEYTDHLMGRIARGLDEIGIRDRTVLMFTCDNGTSGYGKSNATQERGSRVPLVVNAPGLVKAIGPSDALVDFSDILPTLADMAGAHLPQGYEVDGTSFAPVLRGEVESARDWIFSNLAEKRFLRDRRYLLDGAGRLWDCGARRDEQGYKDVSDSQSAEVEAVRVRFNKILENLPAPDPDGPAFKRYLDQRQKKAAKRKPAKTGQAKNKRSEKSTQRQATGAKGK
jgi:arylsulfatase A